MPSRALLYMWRMVKVAYLDISLIWSGFFLCNCNHSIWIMEWCTKMKHHQGVFGNETRVHRMKFETSLDSMTSALILIWKWEHEIDVSIFCFTISNLCVVNFPVSWKLAKLKTSKSRKCMEMTLKCNEAKIQRWRKKKSGWKLKMNFQNFLSIVHSTKTNRHPSNCVILTIDHFRCFSPKIHTCEM